MILYSPYHLSRCPLICTIGPRWGELSSSLDTVGGQILVVPFPMYRTNSRYVSTGSNSAEL